MDKIELLVGRYRELKEQEAALADTMKSIKAAIQTLVEDEGNWQDDAGYARLTHRGVSMSFDGKAVSNLMNAWLTSDDAIMQSCGKMLQANQRATEASTYLSVK